MYSISYMFLFPRQALTELEHVHFLKIEGAPPEEVEDLVAEKLGTNVVDISDSLFGLVEELCTGNPLMITELVSHLKVRACGRVGTRP